jgi:3-isopropylmalate/(R)-2-methylmalate dehydratase small subunit
MRCFVTMEGVAALLDRDNIDTDQVLPSAFMRGLDPDYAAGLFAIWRRDPAFVLSRPGYEATSILVAGVNFGCGSTREHACWALDAFGIRVLIANSFGEVFRENCLKNGLLPIMLATEPLARVAALLRDAPDPVRLQVDLVAQQISGPNGFSLGFDIAPVEKLALLEGLDEIGMTLREQAVIAAWEQAERTRRPWHQAMRMAE